ncbi:MAG: aldo/keto reductase, partial [Lachnospiraceae bacterium]|nr:aldo/keto reductase [Lachnospiraceae bacterium]
HAGPELLDKLLAEHPEVDFIQLQINYADWENPGVSSRANYEVARRHGKSIVVMEPVKGGTLANPPKAVKKLFDDYHSGMSYASWAVRFAASLDGIITVLSGMSNIEQMKDNLSYMKDFKPLNEEEQRIIAEAQRILGHSSTIPCTSCHYCMDGCPKNIRIPDIFSSMNKVLGNGQMEAALSAYREATKEGGLASICIECRQCEGVCPQHIPITDHLKEAVRMFEKN